MPSMKGSSGSKFTGFYQCNSRTSLFVRGNKSYHNGSRRRRSKSALSLLSTAERGSSILKVIYPSRTPIEELHHHFPFLPKDELPINVFTCALSKDILLQGRMFVTQHWICFYSNIFGYETKVKIELKNIVLISREKTVFFVPNAISITTASKRYLFCSFLSRETVYKLLMQLWQTKLLGSKADGTDGPPLDLAEEEVILKDLPVEDFHNEDLNVFGTPSMSITHSIRRSASFGDLESTKLKNGGTLTTVGDGVALRGATQAERPTYPFVYDVSLEDFTDEPPGITLQKWKELQNTQSTNLDDITAETNLSKEEEVFKLTEETHSKDHHICFSILLGIFHLVFNLLWIIIIIVLFPFRRLSRQGLILFASSILFCVLTVMTVVMLSRVHDLSQLLEAGPHKQFSDPLCDYNDAVGHYQRYLDQKRLERARSILKTNLMTVNQIHEALTKLSENLNS